MTIFFLHHIIFLIADNNVQCHLWFFMQQTTDNRMHYRHKKAVKITNI